MVMVPKERKRPRPSVPARRPHCPSKDVDGMKVVLRISILDLGAELVLHQPHIYQ